MIGPIGATQHHRIHRITAFVSGPEMRFGVGDVIPDEASRRGRTRNGVYTRHFWAGALDVRVEGFGLAVGGPQVRKCDLGRQLPPGALAVGARAGVLLRTWVHVRPGNVTNPERYARQYVSPKPRKRDVFPALL